jgi:hypothetical protein
MMNAEDVSKYYYCFTLAGNGFQGDGKFYKYLQKCVTKLIKEFESNHLRLMFVNFHDIDNCRLNKGVRGRLMDRLLELMD